MSFELVAPWHLLQALKTPCSARLPCFHIQFAKHLRFMRPHIKQHCAKYCRQPVSRAAPPLRRSAPQSLSPSVPQSLSPSVSQFLSRSAAQPSASPLSPSAPQRLSADVMFATLALTP